MKANLTHIALHVRSFEASVEFYRAFCALRVVHERQNDGTRVAWLAEPGRATELVIVIIGHGPGQERRAGDFGHLGFAVESREDVDAVAKRAEDAGCLVWPARQEEYPVGYYCGVADPDGNVVEFSYGQPLGPDAKEFKKP